MTANMTLAQKIAYTRKTIDAAYAAAEAAAVNPLNDARMQYDSAREIEARLEKGIDGYSSMQLSMNMFNLKCILNKLNSPTAYTDPRCGIVNREAAKIAVMFYINSVARIMARERELMLARGY